MKPETYLWRALVSAGLWLAIVVILWIFEPGSNATLAILIPGLLLAVILGRAIIGTLAEVTGLTFLFNWFGVLVFYAIITVLSAIIAPIYAAWNLIRYFVVRRTSR